MKFKIIILPMVVLALSACKQEPRPIPPHALEDIYCIENMDFACRREPPPGSNFFKANINGQDMCISTAEEGYSLEVKMGAIFHTPASAPSLNLHTPLSGRYVALSIEPPFIGLNFPEFMPRIRFRLPVDPDTIIHPLHYYLDKYMPTEGDLPIGDDLLAGNGFYMGIGWECFLPGKEYMTSSGGSTVLHGSGAGMGSNPFIGARNVKITVKSFEREEDHAAIFYRIVLDVEGTFTHGLANNWQLHDHILDDAVIKDGVLDVGFTVEK